MTEHVSDAIAWAERVWERPVQEVRELKGGWTSTMLRLTADDGSRAVLRLMTQEPWRRHAPGLLARESETQRQLLNTAVPAPTTLAVDPDGAAAGTPAHLMSWLPGSLDLIRTDDAFVDNIARLLVTIHGVHPEPARPRVYQSWATEAKRVVPQWSSNHDIWKDAFAILETEPPIYPGAFLHRDFHLGNVLWDRGQISGIVDWVETSWGPPGLDLAHCTTYLAMLHGPETAERFVLSYRNLSEAALNPLHQRYWDVMDIVGYLPEPTKVAQPWREMGRGISDRLAQARLEGHLASVLDRRRP